MDIDFFSREAVANPFPYYERIRTAGRCVRNELAGIWMVTGYDDTLAVLRDYATFSSALMGGDTFGPWYEGALTMLGADPPEHTRLRSVVQPLFTHRATRQREPMVRHLVEGLLANGGVPDRLKSGETVDIVSSVAAPLPVLVTMNLLGLPMSDGPLVGEWVDRMSLGSVAAVFADSEPGARQTYQLALAAGKELAGYVKEHASGCAPARGQNVMSHLLAGAREGLVTEPEVVATCVLLLLAGGETTAKGIGNAIVLLGQYPDERGRLRDDPALLETAVEEVLRLTGPSQFDPRLVARDTKIAGCAVRKGEVVWAFQPAANRDPTRFENPQRFDIRRTPNPHLSFGHGIHLCLGAPLARLEMRVVLRCLLRLVPHFEIAGVDYGRGFFVRGPTTCVIA